MPHEIFGLDKTLAPHRVGGDVGPLVRVMKRDRPLLRTTLQLPYETTPDQMRYVLAKLRELLLGHPMVSPDPARVRFISYGAYSKDVEVYCYLDCQDQDTFLAVQEDVLLRIEDIVLDAGTGFAFPSQTTYLAQDEVVDTKMAFGLRIKGGDHGNAQGILVYDFEQAQ